MSIQKWEIRFPLPLLPLLLLCAARTVHGQAGPDRTCRDVTATTCRDPGGYTQIINDDGDCVSSACFPNGTLEQQTAIKMMSLNLQPKLIRSGEFPIQVGVAFNLTCFACATPNKMLTNVVMITPTQPLLPKPVLHTKRFFLSEGKVTDVVLMLVVPLKLSGIRHKQNITCSMTFGSSSTATNQEKASTDTYSLYAFVQTAPVIRGPKEVEAGSGYVWKCVTDEVTVDSTTQFQNIITTKPATPDSIDTQEPDFQAVGKTDNPQKFKVTRTLKFTVPSSFRPAFFVSCRSENKVLGPKKTVIMSADVVRVTVETKPNDLSSIFIIVGVSSGLGGFALGVALVVFYCRKKPAPKPY